MLMAKVRKTAEAVWSGGFVDGIGTVERASRRGAEPIGWRDRIADGPTGATPEELLAAAQAGSFAMALARVLAESGTPAQRLVVSAACVLEVDARLHAARIEAVEIAVAVQAPGLEPGALDAVVARAEAACQVAAALRGDVRLVTQAVIAPPRSAG
jgi:osmotically inducible protein OsmC